VLAFSTACGGENDTTLDITYDPCEPLVLQPEGASDSQLASIDEGFAMWNAIAGTKISREEDAEAQHLVIRFEKSAPMFFGIYRDEVGDIVINSALDDQHERAITIAHELGHALALWHVERDDRKSVMNPGNTSTPPLRSDANELVSTWGACPP
jgi:hypothetical protein